MLAFDLWLCITLASTSNLLALNTWLFAFCFWLIILGCQLLAVSLLLSALVFFLAALGIWQWAIAWFSFCFGRLTLYSDSYHLQ